MSIGRYVYLAWEEQDHLSNGHLDDFCRFKSSEFRLPLPLAHVTLQTLLTNENEPIGQEIMSSFPAAG